MRYHTMRAGLAVGVLAGMGGTALGQADAPSAFVANNGNLRGSVTAFTIAPDGVLTFVQELVLGLSGAGTNAYSISITPSGRFLAVSHATAASVTERISLVRVNADSTLTHLADATTPDSPLDLGWIDDTHLAVTKTKTSATNEVIIYRFDEAAATLTVVDRANTGAFSSKLAVSPDRRFVYVSDSPLGGGGRIVPFRINADRTIDPLTPVFVAGYALGFGMTSDGGWLYSCGGTGSNTVTGFAVDAQAGELTDIGGSPFFSPDSSPKQATASPDGRFVYIGHGSASTVRAFARDAVTGALTQTGSFFDVGIQGALGDIATLRLPGRDLLLFTDKDYSTVSPNYKGLMSFTILDDGSFTQNGAMVETQGIGPNDIAVWAGSRRLFCSADFNNDGDTGTDQDIELFFAAMAGDQCSTCGSADFNGDGDVGTDLDIESFFRVLGGGAC